LISQINLTLSPGDFEINQWKHCCWNLASVLY